MQWPPLEVPKEAVTSPKDGTPKRQDLSKIGRMEEDFDKGYDSDGEIGPFWGVFKQEGEQLFAEKPLSATKETMKAANALINIIEPSNINSIKADDSGKKTVQNNNDNNDKDEPNPRQVAKQLWNNWNGGRTAYIPSIAQRGSNIPRGFYSKEAGRFKDWRMDVNLPVLS